MGVKAEAARAPQGPPDGRLVWREVRRQATALAVTVAVVAVVAFGLSLAAAAMQAGRDETRSADLAVVVAPAAPSERMADHAFEVYRRGYVPAVLLAGEGQAGLKAQLLARGVPEAALLSDGAGAAAPDLRRLARRAADGDAMSALVIAAPEETLLALKIARDQGLRAYGSPTPGAAMTPGGLLGAAARYWRYVLLGL
ncbi:MAG TPA: YdcF family protein [Chloroflexaceae bacterium]|nr:YdcF family protein [Chloroflexaceae bacterium]